MYCPSAHAEKKPAKDLKKTTTFAKSYNVVYIHVLKVSDIKKILHNNANSSDYVNDSLMY